MKSLVLKQIEEILGFPPCQSSVFALERCFPNGLPEYPTPEDFLKALDDGLSNWLGLPFYRTGQERFRPVLVKVPKLQMKVDHGYLNGIHIRESVLLDSQVYSTILTGFEFKRVKIFNTDFIVSALNYGQMIDVSAAFCCFDAADFSQTRLFRAEFRHCAFNLASFEKVKLEDVVFYGCRFDDAKLTPEVVENVRFYDCTGVPKF